MKKITAEDGLWYAKQFCNVPANNGGQLVLTLSSNN
jgi:hypothetical protein